MADGKITLEIEVNDSSLENETQKAAQTAGKKAGNELEQGIEKGAKQGSSKVKSEVSSAGKTAGKEAGDGLESGLKSGANSGSSAASSIIGDLGGKLKNGLIGIAAGLGIDAVFGAMSEMIEVANEYEEDMGKLATAAQVTGVSNKNMSDTYRDMVGVLGETDQSVEAVNHLFQLCGDSTQDLSSWTTIAAGIYATFGDSLPLEGLTEAANETAKVGQVTGPFADALNWVSKEAIANGVALSGNSKAIEAFNSAIEQGMSSEDAFNAALAECSNEQERAALITAAMSGAYTEAGQVYEETNADLIAYRKSQDDLTKAQAEMGKALMPIQSAFSEFGAWLLGTGAEAVSSFVQGLTDLHDGALQYIQPFADAILPALKDAWQQVYDDCMPKLQEIGQRIQEFYENNKPTFDALAEFLGVILPPILEYLKIIVETVFNAFVFAINLLIDAWNMLAPIIEPVILAITDFLQNILFPAIEQAKQVFGDLKAKVEEVFNGIATVVQTVVTVISQLASGDFSGAAQTMTNAIGDMPDPIQQSMTASLDSVTWFTDSVGNFFTQTIPDAAGGMLDTISGVPNSIGNSLGSAINQVSNFASNMANKAQDAGNWFRNNITNAVQSINLWSAGSNIVTGLWNGIVSGGSWLYSSVWNWAKNIAQSAKNALGIHSPSRVFRDQIGEQIAAGVEVGYLRKDPMEAIAKSMKAGVSKVSMAASNQMSFEGFGEISQTINFNQPVETPDQLARTMRTYSHYGLAAANI